MTHQYRNAFWLRCGKPFPQANGLDLRHCDGMIFLTSCSCNLELETVEWTEDWIREVGDEPLQAGKQFSYNKSSCTSN